MTKIVKTFPGMVIYDERKDFIQFKDITDNAKEDLDKIYHLLNGNQPKYNSDNEVVWEEPDKDDLKPFNKFGVQLIMNVLSFYLN